MKAVLQRVSAASVSIDGRVIGEIKTVGDGPRATGLVILLGVQVGDREEDCAYLAQKIVDMRIFADQEGKMNKSISEVGGAILVISQFTLLADWRKGRRPGFTKAAPPEEGNRLYLNFVAELKRLGVMVETGEFGGDMQVALVNDGPVTLVLEHQYGLA